MLVCVCVCLCLFVCVCDFSLLFQLLMGDKEIWQQQAKLLPKPRLCRTALLCLSLRLLASCLPLYAVLPYGESCRGYTRNNKFKAMPGKSLVSGASLLVLIEGLSGKNRTQQQQQQQQERSVLRAIFTYFHACHFSFSFCHLLFVHQVESASDSGAY